ncbi:hypothetical protein F4802DRAFT_152533 [Xylaria palmicola]|nr:hypothetical protein F4802DRAFT_152533 [Xylaria palmicola]
MSSESRQPPWATNKDFAVRLYKLAMTCDSPRLMGWVVCHILPLPSTLLEWSQKQFEMSTISFERLRAGFTYLLRTQKSLCIKYHAIIALQGDTEPNGQLLELLKDAATHSISNWGETFPSYENGVALFDLTQYSDNCLEVIKSSIVPGLAGASGRLTDFTMGFVSRLHQGMQRKQVPEAEAKSIYEGLVRATIRNMSITLLTVEETHIDGQLRDDTISYQNLHRFVASLFQPGLESQRDMFVEKVSFEAMHISDRTKFEALWIPLLQDLLSACEKLKISLSDRRWQAFYQAILECFLRGYVGKSVPKLQPSLISKTVSCLCRECRDLNKFLVHPLQKEYRVHKSDRRMSHFQQELHDIRKYCITKPDPSDSYCVLLTKTGWQDDSKKRARKQRKIEAAKHLHAFDQKKLRAVLADRYDAIITMSMLKRPKNPTTTTSRAPSSTQAREPLAPISANPAQEMARIEAEMDRLVNGRPPMAPAPAKSNVTIHTQPFTTVPPNQTRFMNTAPRPAYTAPVFGMPAYEFQPPLTPMPAPNAVGPAPMYPTTPQYGGVADHVFSTPYMPTWQHPTTSYMPGNTQTAPPVMAANRSVSNASRPPPSKMIPHPVAGAKRKMVELIDLTLDDD